MQRLVGMRKPNCHFVGRKRRRVPGKRDVTLKCGHEVYGNVASSCQGFLTRRVPDTSVRPVREARPSVAFRYAASGLWSIGRYRDNQVET